MEWMTKSRFALVVLFFGNNSSGKNFFHAKYFVCRDASRASFQTNTQWNGMNGKWLSAASAVQIGFTPHKRKVASTINRRAKIISTFVRVSQFCGIHYTHKNTHMHAQSFLISIERKWNDVMNTEHSVNFLLPCVTFSMRVCACVFVYCALSSRDVMQFRYFVSLRSFKCTQQRREIVTKMCMKKIRQESFRTRGHRRGNDRASETGGWKKSYRAQRSDQKKVDMEKKCLAKLSYAFHVDSNE